MHSRYLYSNTPNVHSLPNALLVSIECRGEGIEVVGEFHQSKTPHMAKIQSSKDFFLKQNNKSADLASSASSLRASKCEWISLSFPNNKQKMNKRDEPDPI